MGALQSENRRDQEILAPWMVNLSVLIDFWQTTDNRRCHLPAVLSRLRQALRLFSRSLGAGSAAVAGPCQVQRNPAVLGRGARWKKTGVLARLHVFAVGLRMREPRRSGKKLRAAKSGVLAASVTPFTTPRSASEAVAAKSASISNVDLP